MCAQLERRGVCFETEEDEFEPGVRFTSTFELTEDGMRELRRLSQG